MKVHQPTFGDVNQPGSIWRAVEIAKREHKSMMRYKRGNQWSLQDHCRSQRDTMMHTIRLIARGLLATVERSNRKSNAKVQATTSAPSEPENHKQTESMSDPYIAAQIRAEVINARNERLAHSGPDYETAMKRYSEKWRQSEKERRELRKALEAIACGVEAPNVFAGAVLARLDSENAPVLAQPGQDSTNTKNEL